MARIVWFFDIPDESTLPERLQGLVPGGAADEGGGLQRRFGNGADRHQR